MYPIEHTKEIVDSALDYGSEKCDSLIAKGILSSGSQIRFSQSSIDISKRWEQLRLILFVVMEGSKTGFSERSVSNMDEMKSAVDDTIAFTKKLPESMFYTGVEEEKSEYRDLSVNYDSKIDGFTEKAPRIINTAIDAAVQEGAKRVAGAMKFSKEWTYFKSSLGPTGDFKKTSYDLNVRAFQDELDYSGQGIDCGTKPSEAEATMVEAGRIAGKLSRQAIGAKQGEPGTYDLILTPTVAANVIGGIPNSANPFWIMIGLSPLGDKIGEQIAPDFVNVADNPWIPNGLADRPFDFEGTPTRVTEIIQNGVLRSFLHNTSSATIYETNTTGSSTNLSLGSGLQMLLPCSTNIVFNNGDHNVDEIMETNRPTIYVTSNWYTRFQNYITGDFSTIPRDAMFLIENGEKKPIKNIRISDNLMRMFANIDAMANDRKQVYWWEVTTPTFIPTIRIRDCRITAATI